MLRAAIENQRKILEEKNADLKKIRDENQNMKDDLAGKERELQVSKELQRGRENDKSQQEK